MEQNTVSKSANDKIGGLWQKVFTKDGQETTYYSGEVEIDGVKTYIAVFNNNKTDREGNFHANWPDFVIKKSRTNTDAPAKTQQTQAARQTLQPEGRG